MENDLSRTVDVAFVETESPLLASVVRNNIDLMPLQ